MRKIESEFKRADHLLYVSLKYTKTGDVIRNLLKRWESTIDLCFERLLKRVKRKKKIKAIPIAPKARTDLIVKEYKDKVVREIADLYLFFRRLDSLENVRVHEFRKNVALVVFDGRREVILDMVRLYELNELVKEFIEFVREKV